MQKNINSECKRKANIFRGTLSHVRFVLSAPSLALYCQRASRPIASHFRQHARPNYTCHHSCQPITYITLVSSTSTRRIFSRIRRPKHAENATHNTKSNIHRVIHLIKIWRSIMHFKLVCTLVL